jgi:hypothetical protein
MANVIVHEFTDIDEYNNISWPAAIATVVAAAGSMTTGVTTVAVVITADADTRMTLDGSSVTAEAVPILGAVQNLFRLQGRVARTLKFT